jgi:hypothetical protein
MRTSVLLLSLCLSSVGLLAESAAGVHWTAPQGWASRGPAPMRAVTYAIPPASGDQTGGECGVYFFGAGQGGSPQANIERWNGQFTGANGAPASGKVATRTAGGLKITTLDVAGAYSGLGGPMAAASHAVPGYRLLGAIIEAPGGNVFIKLTGPAKTIAANQQKFELLLGSVQRDK